MPVDELVVAGGLLKNAFLMQIYADVTAPAALAVDSEQAPALGSAIHAAVAAGAYPDVVPRRPRWAASAQRVYLPDATGRGLRRALRGVRPRCTTTSGRRSATT